MSGPIRVLVVDDSAVQAEAISRLLGSAPGIVTVGRALDGEEAVRLARELRPDVITMDLFMPDTDGWSSIARIMSEAPSRILVVSAAADDVHSDACFRAIAMGALELIAKPRGNDPGAQASFARRLIEAVRLMAEVPVVSRRRASHSPRFRAQGSIDVFGIAASTGGPPALARVLSHLPATLPVPVLIAQHLAAGFTGGLVRWLSSESALRVTVAQDGEACQPGTAYLPPDAMDLQVDHEGRLQVSRARSVFTPSGDRLLGSIAAAYGGRGGGAVLTGMGEDGAEGLLAIRRAGGLTLAQDEATSVVYGMPRVASARGAALVVLPLDEIGPAIREWCASR